MKIKKDDAKFLSALCLIFAIIILLANPIDFRTFPSNVSNQSWYGLILLIIGLVGMWYGTK